jgi:hypothetical protein
VLAAGLREWSSDAPGTDADAAALVVAETVILVRGFLAKQQKGR